MQLDPGHAGPLLRRLRGRPSTTPARAWPRAFLRAQLVHGVLLLGDVIAPRYTGRGFLPGSGTSLCFGVLDVRALGESKDKKNVLCLGVRRQD